MRAHVRLKKEVCTGMGGEVDAPRSEEEVKTTQRSIDSAGETFREEEELLEARLFGAEIRAEGESERAVPRSARSSDQ